VQSQEILRTLEGLYSVAAVYALSFITTIIIIIIIIIIPVIDAHVSAYWYGMSGDGGHQKKFFRFLGRDGQLRIYLIHVPASHFETTLQATV